MFDIRYVTMADKPFWFTLDPHLSEKEFNAKVRNNQGYVIGVDNQPIGILRYNLFWDNTPFVTLIKLQEAYHGKGFGSQAMNHWESEMQELGYKLVMTSTQSDEQAQHFYRKLGYVDSGCLLLNDKPAEIFFVKWQGIIMHN